MFLSRNFQRPDLFGDCAKGLIALETMIIIRLQAYLNYLSESPKQVWIGLLQR